MRQLGLPYAALLKATEMVRRTKANKCFVPVACP
jgi:hypothetical protein